MHQYEEHEQPAARALRAQLPAGCPVVRFPSFLVTGLWPFECPDPRGVPDAAFPYTRYPLGDMIALEIARQGLRGRAGRGCLPGLVGAQDARPAGTDGARPGAHAPLRHACRRRAVRLRRGQLPARVPVLDQRPTSRGRRWSGTGAARPGRGASGAGRHRRTFGRLPRRGRRLRRHGQPPAPGAPDGGRGLRPGLVRTGSHVALVRPAVDLLRIHRALHRLRGG